jgi:exosortase C (VPDSG-CTERM-specific)
VARLKVLATIVVLLVICFGRPLYELVTFAVGSELYSHIVLVPFIAVYLAWLKRKELVSTPQPNLRWASVCIMAAVALLVGCWACGGKKWEAEDYLALMTGSFLLLVTASCFALPGSRWMRVLAFPAGFLVFALPFPSVVRAGIETLLQHGSAEAAFILFKLTGMPVFRQGTQFHLPGFSMEVAPQCSGIHSSLVLFITALLAGYLLLRSNGARAALVALVIPLAMLRNGIRICVLGHLCVGVNPDWINSDLHRRGGPIFFVASLIPFFLLLFVLRKLERRRSG